jgi:hypothetical protein
MTLDRLPDDLRDRDATAPRLEAKPCFDFFGEHDSSSLHEVSISHHQPAGYDVATMMARIQIALSPEDQRRARARATELGISFAEYVRRLIARDLGESPGSSDPHRLFDLGDSGGSDVAVQKYSYVGEAVDARH